MGTRSDPDCPNSNRKEDPGVPKFPYPPWVGGLEPGRSVLLLGPDADVGATDIEVQVGCSQGAVQGGIHRCAI